MIIDLCRGERVRIGGQAWRRAAERQRGSIDATASVSERTAALADRFALAHGEVLALLQPCSASARRSRCTAQGWSVAVTAGEIAQSYQLGGTLLQAVAAGQCPWPTWEYCSPLPTAGRRWTPLGARRTSWRSCGTTARGSPASSGS